MGEEDAFLAAIRIGPNDDLTRLVYADWLDERGQVGGAFLRVECELFAIAPTNPRQKELQATLREASLGVDPGWLAVVSRVPIENCRIEFRFRCPKQWEQLQPTAEEGVRFCGECRKQVFFCGSIEVAQTHAALGDCVAVDPRLARKPRDLESSLSSLWDSDSLVFGMMGSDEDELNPKGEEPPPPQPGRDRRQRPR